MFRTTLSVFALAAAGVATSASAQSDNAATATDGVADYCANAFLAGDLDADDRLSDSELAEMRDATYQSLDANNDGSISREEFVACETAIQQAGIEKIGETWGPDQNRAAAAMMGEVWPGIGPEAAEPVVPDGDAAGGEAEAAVTDTEQRTGPEAADAGGEPGLSREAYMQAANARYTEFAADSVESEDGSESADAGAQTDDTPGGVETAGDWSDPFIYLGEGERVSDLSREEYAARAAFSFETTDADGNEMITREEFISRGENLTPDVEEILGKFGRIDTNADDMIDTEEYGAAMEADAQSAREASGAGEDAIPVIYYFFYQRG